MALHRQRGSRNWARGIFAFFWIALGGVSGLYLYTAFADPSALGGQLVRLNPVGAGDTTAALSSASPDQQLAALEASLRDLTQQVAALSSRLKAEDKEAANSPESSAKTSQSEPAAPSPTAPEAPKPEVAAAPPASSPPPSPPAEQAAAKPEEKPAETPKPVETAKPAETATPEAKPTEQAAAEVTATPPAAEPAPKPFEPPPVVVSPMDDLPAEEGSNSGTNTPATLSPPASNGTEPSTPSPATPASSSSPAAPSSTSSPVGPALPSSSSAPAPIESAALDPVALPPAANDGSTRYGIEIGIVAKQDALRPLWREFLTKHGALVAGLQPRRVLAPDKKWRLIAGPFASAAEATQACALFKKASRPCEATVYAGDGL